MIETYIDIKHTQDDEIRQVAEVLTAIRRARKTGKLDLFIAFMAKEHCAIKIAKGPTMQTHMATIFAQTEYDPDENPQDPLEIKIDANELTVENITDSVINFLFVHFPEALNCKINFYKNYRDYKTKNPIKIIQAAA
ncbi:MAG: hypothetical protein UU23_C0001G0022 [Candidatus Curtissbacteria bacterium GW2011_GWA1_40_9]|uniref:Uncharacterized protein n=1 Tax=Candidatus Curtissbacteria bacterium GW2011_GWA1_40_9 TaxID=1618408 RepID=A0A0G0TMP9_9BACT|nr:MAG: hypothetical protein UU23_C0001G0022 [Candidatus Curtissbacteria bacterium GW2011_GWA1_40_9]